MVENSPNCKFIDTPLHKICQLGLDVSEEFSKLSSSLMKCTLQDWNNEITIWATALKPWLECVNMIYFDGDSALLSSGKTQVRLCHITSVFVFRTGDQNWRESILTARKHSRTVWHWNFSELERRLVIVISPTACRCLQNWRSPLDRIPIFKLFWSTSILLENIFLLFRSGNTRPPSRNKPGLLYTW